MPVEKVKSAAPSKAAAKPEPEPEQPSLNPFADSVPFPESPVDSSYDRMEEVSLEQLLSEGRERPATMSGNVPLPVDLDDIEELDAEALVPIDIPMEDSSVAVAVMDEPAGDDRLAILEQRVKSLQSELDSERAEHRTEMEEVLRQLGDLTSRLRQRLDS